MHPCQRSIRRCYESVETGPAAIFLILVMSLCSALWFGPAYCQAGDAADMEYRIKAAFILNFAKFVSWPGKPQEDRNASVIMCVLGENPFGEALDSIRGKKVQNRMLRIVHSPSPKELPFCHILFISKDLEDNETDILRQVQYRPVLTIGETGGFALRGGMINFIMVDNKLRFEINLSAVENASLKMSSQLLKLAVIVETENEVGN